jgi:flagellar biosynthesis protein FlhA
LAEHVRQRLGRAICLQYRDAGSRLHVVTLDPALEERIRAGVESGDDRLEILLSPYDVEAICSAIESETRKLTAAGHLPIVLVAPSIRATLRQLTATHMPQLVVLGYNEITRDTKIESVGMVSMEEESGQEAIGGYRKSA